MSRAYFICGTGTDVGKSVVCAGLLKNIKQSQAIKIIQTGQNLFDQEFYAQACHQSTVKTLRHFKLAASPHLAADVENRPIGLGKLIQEIKTEVSKTELTLLEGSGGLMVPLSESETFLDLMAALDYPVILVVNNILGAINQALLSLTALKRAGLTIEGLIFTHPDHNYMEDQPIPLDNINIIKKHGRVPVLAVIPHMPDLARPNGDRKRAWPQIASSLKDVAASLAKVPEAAEAPDTGLTDFDQGHLWHPYCPAPNEKQLNWPVEKTLGNYIYLKSGLKLLDGMSSWWSAIHGYNQPELIKALKEQAEIMPHVMFGGLTHEPAVKLGRELLKILPVGLKKIFWADSGSVAVEVALKMAVQYWQGQGRSAKTKIISHYGAYHGDTLGAMSVGDPLNGMHSRFKGYLPQQIFVSRPETPFNATFDESSLHQLAETAAKHHHECAAVIIEPIVQGAGGMWIYHPEYLKALDEICRRYDLLLICDEIATGFGRTGQMFASDWASLSPDIMCLGKALTGGTMTLAATVCTERVAEGISKNNHPLMHGPTFMANPLACRVALASLELLKSSNWSEQVHSVENNLTASLADCRNHKQVSDVRVLGAIGVVEMKKTVNVTRLRQYFAEQHAVWIKPFNKLIYVMPPYAVTNEECLRLGWAISQAVGDRKWV